jgi:hypothetical protein
MSFTLRASAASAKKKKHLRGLLRAGGYVVLLSLGLGVFQLRAAHAEMKNRTVELGRQMYQLANATQQDVNKLTLNGQPMWLSSSLARDTVSDVLDRYEADCEKHSAQPAADWRELANKLDEKKEEHRTMSSSGVMRGGDGHEGSVVCFTKGEGSKATLGEALKSFVQTGELGALGNLRYVYAKQSGRGHTVVLTAWTDDKFNLADLAPSDGSEAHGSDFPDLPRPETSTRLMSARVEGTPFGVNIYRNKQGPENVAKFYDGELTKRGWIAIDTELAADMAKRGEENKDGAVGRIYEHDGVVLSLATSLDEGDTITALGLAGVTATDGSKTDTGVKASDAPPATSVSERAPSPSRSNNLAP